MNIPSHAVRLIIPPPAVGANPKYGELVGAAIANWHVAVVWIYPDQAARYLEFNNARNRPLSISAWRRLWDKIDSGFWQLNGEAVVFGTDGHLLNGQHRLRAIANGDNPIPVFVVYNVDPESFTTFDQGKRRNAADVLSVLDYHNCSTLASALGWAQRHAEGRMHDNVHTPIPNELIADVVRSYPRLPESAALVKSKWCKSRLFPPGLHAFLYHEFNLIDDAACTEFFDRVVDGIGVERGSHEFLLKRRLDGDLSGRRTAADQVEIAAVTIKTWNNIRRNHSPGDVIAWKRASNEKFPAIA